MKTKSFSRTLKLLIAIAATVASVATWYGHLGSATILEIWEVAGLAYGTALGTIDLNILVDNFREKKKEN